MAKTLEGMVVCATFERMDTFNWNDPTSGQMKPIRSAKVLLAHGDGTVTRESLTLPAGFDIPSLEVGKAYAFPCTASVSKKTGKVNYTLRTDLKPFPAPTIN